MIYLYRRNKTGICIDRVYGHDGIVELPETLEGLPVTELGAYIFSDHIDRGDLEKCRMSGKFCTEDGLKVQDEDGKELGTVKDVIETGANDVYEVEMADGKSLLLPAIKQCILNVDVENGTMQVHVLEGLLDL